MEKVVEQIKKNKKVLLIALMVLVGVIGLSYAWFTLVINKNTSLNLRAKTNLDITLVEPSNPIVINTAIPMADADGLTTTAYTFKVVNNDNQNIAYQLYLDDVALESGEHKIPDNNIKYSLTRNGGSENPKLLTMTQKTVGSNTVRELDDTIISGKTTNTAVENVYTLKLWIDSEATNDIAGYKFKGKIRLEATQTEDDQDDIYDVTGYLYDDNNQPVSNGTVAVYSEQKTATTNSAGLLNINNLEYGTHSVYYVPNKSVSQISGLTKGEIEAISGVGKATIHTGKLDDDITLSNGYTLKNMTKKKVSYNEHIKAVYTYNENGSGEGSNFTGCISGEEAGCVAKSKITKTMNYPVGTIVKYEVADGVEEYFNVLYDNGDNLTMQHAKRTLTTSNWLVAYSIASPASVISELKEATNWEYANSWSINNSRITTGTGSFQTDSLVCNYTSGNHEFPAGSAAYGSYCDNEAPTYDSFSVNSNVRFITANEASELGCRFSEGSTVPRFLNYDYYDHRIMARMITMTTGFDGVENYKAFYIESENENTYLSQGDTAGGDLKIKAVINVNK